MKQQIIKNVLIGLTIFMPIATMASQAVPSPLFYTITAFSLYLLIKNGFNTFITKSKDYKLFLICMAAPLLAVVISGLYHGKIAGLDFETALRFLIGTWLICFALSTISNKHLKYSVWGIILTAIITSAYIYYLVFALGENRPQTIAVYNAVGYGSLTALFMVCTIFSIKIRLTKYIRLETAAKLVIAVLAFLAVILTQTRTAWMALPAFIIIGAILFVPIKSTGSKPNRKGIFKLCAVAIVALIAISAVFISSDTMRQRAQLAYDEAVSCVGDESKTDNSICIRFQLWRASIDMLNERPLAGNGSKRYFNDYLQQESFKKGIVSTYVATGWGEPHNDMFLALSSYGYLGGLALFLIYIAPAIIFIKRLAYKNTPETRAAAAIGLSICLGFLIFGFTETMFRHMRTVGFYAVMIGLFIALSNTNQVHHNRVTTT